MENRNSGHSIYKGIKMSDTVADIIVASLAIILAVFIVSAILISL